MHSSDHLFYQSEGVAKVSYDGDSIQIDCSKWPEEQRDLHIERLYGDIMDGEEFYELVNGGSIIDYDGIIGNVYINGYDSNLGLSHRGLHQGGFLVNGATWLQLCDKYEIEVEWCNK